MVASTRVLVKSRRWPKCVWVPATYMGAMKEIPGFTPPQAWLLQPSGSDPAYMIFHCNSIIFLKKDFYLFEKVI